MNKLTITLTHANDHKKMCFTRSQIFYFYYSAPHKCTHIVSIGGAFAPVLESVEQIDALLNQTTHEELSSNEDK
jgi:hypothetical protein